MRAAGIAAMFAAMTLILFGPWIDLRDPSALMASASAGGERYVNSVADLPTTYIAVRWVDPHGHDLRAAETTIRTWCALLVRALFAIYVAIELIHLWRSRIDLRAAVETATRILLVGLLLVFTQVLPWYFVWPLTLAAVLGLSSDAGVLAIAYTVLYLPMFYAGHENIVPSAYVAPLLLTFVVLPPVMYFSWRLVTRAWAGAQAARAVEGAFRA
jgi:hypothetical protein